MNSFQDNGGNKGDRQFSGWPARPEDIVDRDRRHAPRVVFVGRNERALTLSDFEDGPIEVSVYNLDDQIRESKTNIQSQHDVGSSPVYKKYFGDLAVPSLSLYRKLLVRLGNEMLQHQAASGENKEIPAGYTYLGQFLAHEMSHMDATDPTKPYSLTKPTLGLSSLFPHPNSHPDHPGEVIVNNCPVTVTCPACEPNGIGLTRGSLQHASDLPRLASGLAVVRDSRADDLLPLAQLTMLFLKFSNVLSQAFKIKNEELRIESSLHFQSIILFDYMKKIVSEEIWTDVYDCGRQYILPTMNSDTIFQLPLEFAAAAFRFGHSMINERYEFWAPVHPLSTVTDFWNQTYASKLAADMSSGSFKGSLASSWATNWTRLFAVPGAKCGEVECDPINSSRIDTRLARQLSALRKESLPKGGDLPANLAVRTLQRAADFQLATAQQCIDLMNFQLKAASRAPIVKLTPCEICRDEDANVRRILEAHSNLLIENTPVWFYVLKEAQVREDGRQLGTFGGRLVMETVHAAIEATSPNILKGWRSKLSCRDGVKFKMVDLLDHIDVVNPHNICKSDFV